ncbi:MAG TPA: HEAT repeat domain-containing protein [Pyrinomonadaceae bacterium]|jgi:HEAT repeat protein
MNKESNGHDFAVQKNAWSRDLLGSRCVRLGLVAAMGASLALSLPLRPGAQQRYRETPVKVTGVTTSGNVVSISADGSLSHAQTWQDPEGFHVVLVNGEAAGGVGRGVKVQRVGNSLELVVPVRRGASVTVEPRGNRLDLVVSGGGGALNVENFPVEQPQQRRQERARAQESVRQESAEGVLERVQQPRGESKRRVASESGAYEPAQGAPPAPAAPQQAAPAAPPQQPAQPEAAQGATTLGPAPAQQEPAAPAVAQPAAATVETPKGVGLLSLVTSLPSLLALVLAALAAGAFVFVRRRRAGGGESEPAVKVSRSEARAAGKQEKAFEQSKGDRRKSDITVPFERRKSGQGAEDEATRRSRELAADGVSAQAERGVEPRQGASAPAFIYGSYRIDQEVASLVAGGPHSIEVLASRAADDRRAVETSLLKALRAPETDEDGRRRARTALEDYGFVARSCAALLLGSETFERVSAARTLGDMRSSQALPFLTEALYDHDPVVRTECIQSLGALGLPSAIGALLDVARRHQDVPASVLGPALTACSVESLELSWDSPAASRSFDGTVCEAQPAGGDVRTIVPAFEGYEELPEYVHDEALDAALVRLDSTDAETRATAAQQLAQFQVRRAVAALAHAAGADAEASVRSAAVNSLGLINHESVFAAVIVALADEAREVRAAAARALSRLNFDRADAYVRLAETADARTSREVARACVKAGLAAQAVGRLTSEDRRQAYEAFSLLSLCVRGGEAQPLVEAVESHRDINTRLTCVQLLGDVRGEGVLEQLALLADNSAVPEQVRRSIRETVERAPAPQPVAVG